MTAPPGAGFWEQIVSVLYPYPIAPADWPAGRHRAAVVLAAAPAAPEPDCFAMTANLRWPGAAYSVAMHLMSHRQDQVEPVADLTAGLGQMMAVVAEPVPALHASPVQHRTKR